jgi:hypothetical protein
MKAIKALIMVNGKVIYDKNFDGWDQDEITHKMALYIQEERLTEMGTVTLQLQVPKKATV